MDGFVFELRPIMEHATGDATPLMKLGLYTTCRPIHAITRHRQSIVTVEPFAIGNYGRKYILSNS